jgi:uncharacterized protein YpiB (UPF0302 family)
MNKWVSIADKRQFLKWFVEHHRLKHPDARKILDYVLKRPHILENITFTEKIDVKKRTIIISSINSDEVGFVYYYNQQKTENAAVALGDLMANPMEKIYLIVHFFGKDTNRLYAEIIETPRKDALKNYERFQQYSEEADAVIDRIMLQTEIKNVRSQIDAALDKKDEQQFHSLVRELMELERKLKKNSD